MKIFRLFFLFFALFTSVAFAETEPSAFESTRDLIEGTNANISLLNHGSTTATVYGLYIPRYAYVPTGSNCDTPTIIYSGNITGGSFVTPVTIAAGKSAPLGSNYLYNMILQAIYYENNLIPSSPPGCALPGCTWGSDTTQYNWCIYLGALAPIANSNNYSSNIPPSTDAVSGSGYHYDLISNYHYIGPIACNDQTLTCSVTTSQVQSFP